MFFLSKKHIIFVFSCMVDVLLSLFFAKYFKFYTMNTSIIRTAFLSLGVFALASTSAYAKESGPSTAVAQVVSDILQDEDQTLTIVKEAVEANPEQAADIALAAIDATNATDAMAVSIVEAASLGLPAENRDGFYNQVAPLVPDSSADILALEVYQSTQEGDSFYITDSPSATGKSGRLFLTEAPNSIVEVEEQEEPQANSPTIGGPKKDRPSPTTR